MITTDVDLELRRRQWGGGGGGGGRGGAFLCVHPKNF